MSKTYLENWRKTAACWTKLVNIYAAKLRANPRSRIYLPLADALIRLGRKSEAVVILEDALWVFPNDCSAKVLMARLRYMAGEISLAKVSLEEVVLDNPDSIAGVSLLCDIYASEELYESAEKIACGLLDYYPDVQMVKALYTKYHELAGALNNDVSTAIDIVELEPEHIVLSGRSVRHATVNKLEIMLLRISTMKERGQQELWVDEKF